MLRPIGPRSRRISVVSALASSNSCWCSSLTHSITSRSTASRSLSSRATVSSCSRQQRLYFLPLPHGHGSLREGTLARVRAPPDTHHLPASPPDGADRLGPSDSSQSYSRVPIRTMVEPSCTATPQSSERRTETAP